MSNFQVWVVFSPQYLAQQQHSVAMSLSCPASSFVMIWYPTTNDLASEIRMMDEELGIIVLGVFDESDCKILTILRAATTAKIEGMLL